MKSGITKKMNSRFFRGEGGLNVIWENSRFGWVFYFERVPKGQLGITMVMGLSKTKQLVSTINFREKPNITGDALLGPNFHQIQTTFCFSSFFFKTHKTHFSCSSSLSERSAPSKRKRCGRDFSCKSVGPILGARFTCRTNFIKKSLKSLNLT